LALSSFCNLAALYLPSLTTGSFLPGYELIEPLGMILFVPVKLARPSVFPILEGSFYSLIILSYFLRVSGGRGGLTLTAFEE
jgi:hypothetical protein